MSSGRDGASDRSGAAGNGDDRVARSRAGGVREQVGDHGVVELARDVALEAADDLGLGLAFGGAPRGVGARAFAVAQAADRDHVQRAVRVALAAVVDAVAGGASARDSDWAGGAERRERWLAAQTFDVLAGGHEQRGGVPGAERDTVGGDWCGLGDELLELLIEP